MEWKLELVVVPVADVDGAKAFYVDRLGWQLIVDHRASPTFRVVQVLPPGSACAITFGRGLGSMAPGSLQGLHLVVSDIEAAAALLDRRGVTAEGPFHFEAGNQLDGPDPERSDYGSFLSFADPEGNGWLVQEVGRAGH